MLKKLDEALISLHQKILDRLDIEPRKAADFMFKVLTLLTAVHVGLMFDEGIKGFMWVTLALSPVVVVLAFTFKEITLGGMQKEVWFYRIWMLFLFCTPFTLKPAAIAAEFRLLAEIMMLYFAACQKPKPPRKKSSVTKTRLSLT